MLKNLFYISLLYLSFCGCTHTLRGLDSAIAVESIDVYNPSSQVLLDSTIITSAQIFKPLKSKYPNFGECPNGAWIKCLVRNVSEKDTIFSFLTRGVDSLTFYQVNTGFIVKKKWETGRVILILQKESF